MEDSSLKWMGETPSSNELMQWDLGPLPTLDPDLESFLGKHVLSQGADRESDLPPDTLPEPSLKNYAKWVEWHGCYLDMPDWWEEL